jgi:hypothetical protein
VFFAPAKRRGAADAGGIGKSAEAAEAKTTRGTDPSGVLKGYLEGVLKKPPNIQKDRGNS